MTAPCDDCGTETLTDVAGEPSEYYMVHDHVWEAAGVPGAPGTYLCVGCLETRIGRTLRPGDFTPARVNALDPVTARIAGYAWAYRTARLLDRLGAPPLPGAGVQLGLWAVSP